jgi:hypothetical protein
MPWQTKAHQEGILDPTDLGLLGRVFAATSSPEEDDHDREVRASRIIAYFQAGIRDEDELNTLARLPLGR